MSVPRSIIKQFEDMLEDIGGKNGLMVLSVLPNKDYLDMAAVWFPDHALNEAAERGAGYTEWLLGTAVKSSITAAIIHGKNTKPGETSVLKILPNDTNSKN
jgi:hypothetical protein